MRRYQVLVALVATLVAGCASPPRPSAPLRPTHDPNVALFRSDLRAAWKAFRLGGGLNVVVANPRLPAQLTWRRGTGGGFSSSPSVAGGTILLAGNDHNLYALDGANGRPLWIARADNELMSQPLYEQGTVYVSSGDSDAAIWAPPFYKLIGARKSDLLAYAMRTGKPLWQFSLPGTGMPTAALIGSTVIHAGGAALVYAVDARSGAYRWHAYVASDANMSQVADGGDGHIYVAGSYPNAVLELSARDGTIVWRHLFGTYDGALSDCPLALDSRAVYGMYVHQLPPLQRPFAPFGRPAAQNVYALDRRSGVILWDRLLPHVIGTIPPNNEAAIPLLYGGLLYDGSGLAPILSALDPKTGAIKWQLRVKGPIKGGIAARDGVLYFGDLAGYLWAVDARTGLPIGSVKTDVTFGVGSPIILNDSLIVGGTQGTVLAVPLEAIRRSYAVAGVTTAPRGRHRIVVAVLAVLVLIAIAIVLRARRPAVKF